ncbi:hypothetical protein ACLOJK_005147 [Asimina triloba]
MIGVRIGWPEMRETPNWSQQAMKESKIDGIASGGGLEEMHYARRGDRGERTRGGGRVLEKEDRNNNGATEEMQEDYMGKLGIPEEVEEDHKMDRGRRIRMTGGVGGDHM